MPYTTIALMACPDGNDELTAEDIIGKLAAISQIELAKVAAYERKNDNRSTVLTRISALQGDEPWPGYDELTVDEIRTANTARHFQEICLTNGLQRAFARLSELVCERSAELVGDALTVDCYIFDFDSTLLGSASRPSGRA